jgi:hypothetical protein
MDIRVENHGTLFLLHAESITGLEWLESSVDMDARWWTARALVVEPRYVRDIVAGAIADGLEVR